MTHEIDRRSGFREAPPWLLWLMTFINRVGFPIAVCIYLGWVQIKAMPKLVEAVNQVNSTMIKVEQSINSNTEVLRSWRGPRFQDRRGD